MPRLRPLVVASLTLMGVAVCACGDDAGERALRISAPAPQVGAARKICLPADEDGAAAGLQHSVVVEATGFDDGALVTLALDGATPNLGVAQQVTRGTVRFARVTLPQGRHALTAMSSDGRVASAAVAIDVNAAAPLLAFTTLRDGAALSPLDDVAPETAGLQLAVAIDAAVEDGQEVRLTVDGAAAASGTAQGGRVTLLVTVPEGAGAHELAAETSTRCGNAARRTVRVTSGAPQLPCRLTLEPTPGDGYWSAAANLDPLVSGLQGRARVETTPRATVELAVLGQRPADLRGLADGLGNAVFTLDLADGPATVIARCRGAGGETGPLAQTAVNVDTVAPSCRVLEPTGPLGPGDDLDPGDPETDFVVRVAIEGPDVEGEPVQVTVAGVERTAVVAGGTAVIAASLAAPSPAVAIEVETQDHAGNVCRASSSVAHVTEGCAIEWQAPAGDVTVDGDAATPGVQGDLVVLVAPSCVGAEVSGGCGGAGRPATLVDGRATIAGVTLCRHDVCPRSKVSCFAAVVNGGGVGTVVRRDLVVDTQPPLLAVAGVPCGGTIGRADDADAEAPGTQLRVRVVGLAVTRWVEVAGERVNADGGAVAVVTLADGVNRLLAGGTDEGGLVGHSPVCAVTLADLRLSVDSPAAGTSLAGSEVDVCGSVGEPDAATVTVGAAAAPSLSVTAVVDGGGRFCARVAVDEGEQIITVAASTTTGRTASHELRFTVDRTAPAAPMAISAVAVTRSALQVGWQAPPDAARCIVRSAAAAITDEATWDAAQPGGDSAAVSLRLGGLAPGEPRFVAVRCSDAAGNLSPIAAGDAPVTPTWRAGPIRAFDAAALAGADLDGDGYAELVLGAPSRGPGGLGQVLVFRGSPDGPAVAPMVIESGDAGGAAAFGTSLAVIDFSPGITPELAVGAPWALGGAGQVVVLASVLDGDGTTVVHRIDGNEWLDGLALLGDSLAVTGDRLVTSAPGARATLIDGDPPVTLSGWSGTVVPLLLPENDGFAILDRGAGRAALFALGAATPSRVLDAEALVSVPGVGLVVAGGGTLSVLEGDFSAPGPSLLASGDVDGDGAADLVAADGAHMWVWLQRAGQLVPIAPLPTPEGLSPTLLQFTGDTDGDGLDDLAWADGGTGAVQLLR